MVTGQWLIEITDARWTTEHIIPETLNSKPYMANVILKTLYCKCYTENVIL